MHALTVQNLLAISAQIACIAVVAEIIVTLLRLRAADIRYMYWRAVVGLCLLLPWVQRSRPAAIDGSAPAAVSITPTLSTSIDFVAPAEAAVDWTMIIVGMLVGGIAVRLLWIAAGIIKLRRLRQCGEELVGTEHADLQAVIGTRADVRYVADVRQPVTFGWRRPVVLLPETMRDQPAAIREAVLAHELLHVRRRDWAWLVVEEIVRAIFWFHPAVWWLIARVQLAREEVVDAAAVAVTGRRREYVEALLAFADAVPLAPAPAFARRRHLFRRIVLITREDVMSGRRIVASAAVMALVVALGSWYAIAAFPMQTVSDLVLTQKEPGPIERIAKTVSPDNPIPARLESKAPQYPSEAAGRDITATVTLRTTVDAAGTVAELRLNGVLFRSNDSGALLSVEPFIREAAVAVKTWRYEPPRDAPLAFDITIQFNNGKVTTRGTLSFTAAATGERSFTATNIVPDRAIRVGGNVKAPQKVRDVKPVYPSEAREERIQGVVIAEVLIQEDGRVGDARILRSIPALDGAALEAVRQWEFTPTHLNGAAVPVIMTVTIQFSLQ